MGGGETLCRVYRRGRNIHEKGEGECHTERRAKEKENKDTRVQGGKYEWRRENLEIQGQTTVLSESVVIKRSAGKGKGVGVDYYRREYQEEM
jgi:hypothetical protein